MTNKKLTPNSSSTRGGYRENAGRKSGWNHRETCTIRIPKTFASQLVELARRLDKGEKIDTDTESFLLGKDFVTQSIPVESASSGSVSYQLKKEAAIDIDTKSKLADDDTVTQSEFTQPKCLIPQAAQLEKAAGSDNDTKSILVKNDLVTQSNWMEVNQTGCPSIPNLKEALSQAKTIIKAKKSARESIARLLSKLYSATVSPDDLHGF